MKEEDVLVTVFVLSSAICILVLTLFFQGTKLKESEVRLRECITKINR